MALPHPASLPPPTHWLVLDFEATCDAPEQLPDQEIIEFPVVAVDANTHQVVAQFRTFVRPLRKPRLTPFCTALTGIQQQQVEHAPSLDDALKAFHCWMVLHGFAQPEAAAAELYLAGAAAASPSRQHGLSQPPQPAGGDPWQAEPAKASTLPADRAATGAAQPEDEPSAAHAPLMEPDEDLPASDCPSDEHPLSHDSHGNATTAPGTYTGPRRHPLFVTCGDWDVKHMHKEAGSRGIALPAYWRRFCNVKVPFSAYFNSTLASPSAPGKGGTGAGGKKGRRSTRLHGMMEMLHLLGLPHEGRHHSGLDDARNIARIAAKLAAQGGDIVATSSMGEHGAFVKV